MSSSVEKYEAALGCVRGVARRWNAGECWSVWRELLRNVWLWPGKLRPKICLYQALGVGVQYYVEPKSRWEYRECQWVSAFASMAVTLEVLDARAHAAFAV